MQRPAPLSFPRLLNARDLGGHPTVDGATTRWRSLVRSDDLTQLSAAGLEALTAYGIQTVVDLRWPEEAEQHPSPIPRALPRLRYQRVSLLTPSEAEWRARGQEPDKEQWSCAVLQHARADLARVLTVIAAAPPGPLLFHCVAGKDRTGLVAALLLALAETEPQAIAADYAASGECLRAGYLERYAGVDPARVLDAVRCPPEGAYNMLRYLAAAGGVTAFLGRIGLTSAEVARLRARLRD